MTLTRAKARDLSLEGEVKRGCLSLLLDTSLPGFQSLASAPKAALIVVHGLAEHSERYRDIARQCSERGISTFAYDQRGHGNSPAARTHVARFEHYVDDLMLLGEAVRRAYPKLPVFVWGHSMGTVVAILAAARPASWMHGVITTSNSLEIFRRGLNPRSTFFRAASAVVPRVRIPLGLDGAKISTDEAVQRAYVNDPRIPRTASLRLIVEFAAACERSREVAPKLQLPWLIVHGEADAIAPVEGSRVLFDLLGSKDKTLHVHQGLRHEVHNEKPAHRDAFLQMFGDWILQRAE